jgi:NAD-dependent deacetylase
MEREPSVSVEEILDALSGELGPVLWLTGAGISAESGIPTFRGEEGYWQVGSRHYQPQEMATWRSFCRMPDEVWTWYLYRRSVCRAAEPNPAHCALAELEGSLGDDFCLVTQNVDGLHLRAGNSLRRTYQIHGNIDYMRRAGAESAAVPIPDAVGEDWTRERALSDEARALLSFPDGAPARPHVLWFDECYDEANYRLDSAVAVAAKCRLLVVVGTTGGTNLPLQIGMIVARRGVPIIVINPETNPFVTLGDSDRVVFLQGTAGEWVPRLAGWIQERMIRSGT